MSYIAKRTQSTVSTVKKERKNTSKRNVRIRGAKCISVLNAPENIDAPNWIILWLAIGIIILLACFIPAAKAEQLKCEAADYEKVIDWANKYVDYTYESKGKFWRWHVEDIDNMNDADDWLELSDKKHSIVYPAKCEKYKGE